MWEELSVLMYRRPLGPAPSGALCDSQTAQSEKVRVLLGVLRRCFKIYITMKHYAMVATLMVCSLSTQVLSKAGRPFWAGSPDPADRAGSTKQDHFHRCSSAFAIRAIKRQRFDGSFDGTPSGVCNRRISMPQAC